MKKYVILVSLFFLLFNACKEEPKCCCINFNLGINLLLKKSSESSSLDTNYLKANNQLTYFAYTDSTIYLQIRANTDSTQDDQKVNTVKLFNVSPAETDTIITEISGSCGRTITKIWYNGILKYSNVTFDDRIVVIK